MEHPPYKTLEEAVNPFTLAPVIGERAPLYFLLEDQPAGKTPPGRTCLAFSAIGPKNLIFKGEKAKSRNSRLKPKSSLGAIAELVNV
jgi:hypothetical protein